MGPEIALTFLRNELIVKLQNSQMEASYGRNGENFWYFLSDRVLFKMTRFLFKMTSYIFKMTIIENKDKVPLKVTAWFCNFKKKPIHLKTIARNVHHFFHNSPPFDNLEV